MRKKLLVGQRKNGERSGLHFIRLNLLITRFLIAWLVETITKSGITNLTNQQKDNISKSKIIRSKYQATSKTMGSTTGSNKEKFKELSISCQHPKRLNVRENAASTRSIKMINNPKMLS
jgi:hypothetical protein